MDPHISLAGALFQAPRVAGARSMPVVRVEGLIREQSDSPTLDALGGEPIVNVLELNRALDAAGE
jgi:K+-transporting ATPase ATPase C chain